jgi:hypothetical protein
MLPLYEPEAVLIAKDGRTVTGHTGIAAELERDLSLGLPLEAKADQRPSGLEALSLRRFERLRAHQGNGGAGTG